MSMVKHKKGPIKENLITLEHNTHSIGIIIIVSALNG